MTKPSLSANASWKESIARNKLLYKVDIQNISVEAFGSIKQNIIFFNIQLTSVYTHIKDIKMFDCL